MTFVRQTKYELCHFFLRRKSNQKDLFNKDARHGLYNTPKFARFSLHAVPHHPKRSLVSHGTLPYQTSFKLIFDLACAASLIQKLVCSSSDMVRNPPCELRITLRMGYSVARSRNRAQILVGCAVPIGESRKEWERMG